MTPEQLDALATLGTATLSMQLLKHGVRSAWMRGPRALVPGKRLAGPAFTLRFIPAREDLANPEHYAQPGSLREAVEAAPPGSVLVMDARGHSGAGSIGDILAQRLYIRGVRGVVSDGVIRDLAGVLATELPVWCAGSAAPPSIGGLLFAGWGEPIGCGGVAVFPRDIIVADDDGALVIPAALADSILAGSIEQDRFERFVQEKVREGRSVVGLYPPDETVLAEYQQWLDSH